MSNIISGIMSNEQLARFQNLYTNDTQGANSESESFSEILSKNLTSIPNSTSGTVRNVPLGKFKGITFNNSSTNYDSNTTINDDLNNSNTTVDTNTDNYTNSNLRVEIKAKDSATKNRIANAVEKSAKQYGVDPNLILAVMQTESYFNPNCTSKSGAMGLMQLMPENVKALNVKDPYNIEDNIDGGTRHLKEYIDRYNGDIEMALMAYNGGPTRMMKRGVKSINDIYKMPKETQNYVPKVMKIYRGN